MAAPPRVRRPEREPRDRLRRRRVRELLRARRRRRRGRGLGRRRDVKRREFHAGGTPGHADAECVARRRPRRLGRLVQRDGRDPMLRPRDVRELGRRAARRPRGGGGGGRSWAGPGQLDERGRSSRAARRRRGRVLGGSRGDVHRGDLRRRVLGAALLQRQLEPRQLRVSRRGTCGAFETRLFGLARRASRRAGPTTGETIGVPPRPIRVVAAADSAEYPRRGRGLRGPVSPRTRPRPRPRRRRGLVSPFERHQQSVPPRRSRRAWAATASSGRRTKIET